MGLEFGRSKVESSPNSFESLISIWSSDSAAPDRRAITTRSRSVANSDRRDLNQARIRRLKRLRTTAFPTFRLAVIPSRDPGCPEVLNILDLLDFTTTGAVIKTISRCACRRPRRNTRRKSRESRSRSDRRKRPVSSLMIYLDATVAASRLRPFARRRFRIARPAFVFIRSLKPCLRRRLIRLGWNVRFIAAEPHSRLFVFQ